MRMTLHSDYALRLLMYLAVARERRASAEEVAKAYGLSRNHLIKVAQGLVRAGFLASARGRGGGLELAMPADRINVGAVIRAMEQDLAVVECMGENNACVITGACRLKGVMQEALRAWFAVLDKYTLADLTRRPAPMRQLLGVE